MVLVVWNSTSISPIFRFSTDPTRVLPFFWQALSQRMESYFWMPAPRLRFYAPYSSLGLTDFFTGFSVSACAKLSFALLHSYTRNWLFLKHWSSLLLSPVARNYQTPWTPICQSPLFSRTFLPASPLLPGSTLLLLADRRTTLWQFLT